ncbi:MAG: DUF4388 domain-containing protein [Planctomycetes bacterium]|nr:DUF4388 domain-containing protein [Planctomycetota bacterium]
MIPRDQIKNPAHATVESLADHCQELARQMRFFALGGVRANPRQVESLGSLLDRAGGLFQQMARGDNGAATAPFRMEPQERTVALRMLASGGPEVESPAPGRSDERPPSPRHIMVLRGSEGIFSGPDLVSFLGVQQKTGLLEIRTPNQLFTLELDGGQVAHLQSNRAGKGERLGDILVDVGAVDRRHVEEAYRLNPRGRVGELLITAGLVTEQQLFEALQRQIHLLFQRLASEPMERFTFWAGPLMHAQERLRLNATALMLEAARVKDERSKDDPSSLL